MTARKLLALPLAFVGGIILPLFSGCVESDPDHCVNKGGDEFCGEGKYCTNNCGGDYDDQGCLAANAPPPEGCWLCNGSGDNSNCGSIGDGDGDATMTDTTADTSTTDATDTMGTTTAETTSGPECMMSSECAAAEEPLCDAEACVGCGDAVTASCAVEYPATPVCDVGSGECVECSEDDLSACTAEKPACEGGVCVPCSEHDQCMESACNMSTGACMDPDRVWYVDQAAGNSGDGSQGNPFNQLSDVDLLIGDGQEGTIWLVTANAHQEQFHVQPGRTVALLGKSQTGFLQNAGSIAALVEGVAFVGDLRILSSATGFQCATGGEFNLSDVELSMHSGRGVVADGCVGMIRRSSILGNLQGGIRWVDGSLGIENSFVGGDVNDQTALDIIGGTADVVYSTLLTGFGNAGAIRCGVSAGAGTIVPNSILVARTMTPEVIACAQAELSGNALESSLANNTSLGDLNLSWFDLTDGLHLTDVAPGALATAATWQTGDPATDIDLESRPTTDGSPDYAGADVPN